MTTRAENLTDPSLSASASEAIRSAQRRSDVVAAVGAGAGSAMVVAFIALVWVTQGDAPWWVWLTATAALFVGLTATLGVVSVYTWNASDGTTQWAPEGAFRDSWDAICTRGLIGGPEHHELWALVRANDSLCRLNNALKLAVHRGERVTIKEADRRIAELAGPLAARKSALYASLGLVASESVRPPSAAELLAKIPDPALV